MPAAGGGSRLAVGRLSAGSFPLFPLPADPQALECLPFWSDPEPGEAFGSTVGGSVPDNHLGGASPFALSPWKKYPAPPDPRTLLFQRQASKGTILLRSGLPCLALPRGQLQALRVCESTQRFRHCAGRLAAALSTRLPNEFGWVALPLAVAYRRPDGTVPLESGPWHS